MQNEEQETSSFILEKHETLFPQEFECFLINNAGAKVQVSGRLVLTDFRCIFFDTLQKIYLDIPLGYINKCESSTEQVNKVVTCFVEIVTKFNISFRIKSLDFSISKGVDFINKIIGMQNVYAERLGSLDNEQKNKCKKWQLYDDMEIKDSQVYDNHDWIYLPLYPESFRVPRPFIGKRSPSERLIILSLMNEGEKNGLWRSGPGKADPQEQQWVPKAAKSKDHIVIQIKNRSLGSLKSFASHCIELDGPFQLRQSFSKMYQTTYYQSDTQKWLPNVNSSRWFQQIELILSQTNLVLEKFLLGLNVTILSEWDIRSTQITALVQILCQPEYRTFSGFAKLIQKQFIHYGNWYGVASKKQKNEDKGIAFIQFLDCVFQLLSFYPLSFQFNEDFLTFVAINLYSKKYGNFLYFNRCIYDNERWKSQTMISIWSQVDNSNQKFKNAFYVDRNKCEIFELRKNLSMKNFKVWGSLFLRNLFIYRENSECNRVREQYRKINNRHQGRQAETEQLRKKISTQHKTISELKNKIKLLKNGIQ